MSILSEYHHDKGSRHEQIGQVGKDHPREGEAENLESAFVQEPGAHKKIVEEIRIARYGTDHDEHPRDVSSARPEKYREKCHNTRHDESADEPDKYSRAQNGPHSREGRPILIIRPIALGSATQKIAIEFGSRGGKANAPRFQEPRMQFSIDA